ncbi:hypothetical protein J4E91_003235 [Alternaria rosae]|nr:hypothetical protein J4E91_003235 [Alternaria rosae]
MESTNVPERSGSNMSEDSSGSSEDRVRKFQKTGDQGSRLRKTSASNAISAARPLPTINNNAAGRGRAKVPLGPRERPQDFTKQRYDAAAQATTTRQRVDDMSADA